MTSYRVIGIDPALTNTGLVVLESAAPGDYRVTAHTTIKPRANWPMLDRLDLIRLSVEAFLSAHARRPIRSTTLVVIEDPASRSGPARRATHGKNPQSIAVTGQAVGVVVATVLAWVD